MSMMMITIRRDRSLQPEKTVKKLKTPMGNGFGGCIPVMIRRNNQPKRKSNGMAARFNHTAARGVERFKVPCMW
jgi:hypothetical protein